MKPRTSKLRQAIRTMILVGFASVAALANPATALFSGSPSPFCYCHCEHGAAGKRCTRMCELPQYENRPWASSCHKRNPKAIGSGSDLPTSRSRRTNYTEEARR